MQKAKHYLGIFAGLALFTYSAAEHSPNLFGALAKVLPATPYEEFVQVESVAFSGSKYRSVELTLHDRNTNRRKHLVLSKKLFEYPKFQAGDNLNLLGKQTLVGAYVTGFRFGSPKSEANPSINPTAQSCALGSLRCAPAAGYLQR